MSEYNNYESLVHSLANKWAPKLNKDRDDLVGEGNLVFSQIHKKWDRSRGKFTTFLQMSIVNQYKSLAINDREQYVLTSEWVEGVDVKTPEKIAELKSTINSLSKEAQEMISLVLDGPLKLGQISDIKNHLREAGWAWRLIWETIEEVKTIFH